MIIMVVIIIIAVVVIPYFISFIHLFGWRRGFLALFFSTFSSVRSILTLYATFSTRNNQPL